MAGVGGVCTLTEITISLLQWEKVARFTATDEVLLQYIAKIALSRYVRTKTCTQTSTREVRHSPTWHSSESESALERFEPVAVVQQLPDGRGSVFAPVAARRQGEIYKRVESPLI